MKILVVCQYYFPEPFKINDISEELVKKGHEIDVVTGTPNYPMGEIYNGYENGKKSDETINGVNIHRCKIIPRKNKNIYRLLNYISYPRQAIKHLKRTNKKYDVIFVYQLSPSLMAKPAIYLKKKYNTKVLLYCLDLWPESLKAGGVKETSLLFKYFEKQSRNIYRNCDKILVTSNSFTKYLIDRFEIEKSKIDYLPQYAESLFDAKKCRKTATDTIDLMFAGNLGVTQNLDLILEAAKRLRDIKNIRFHIVGDGSEYERLVKKTRNEKLNNIIFYGRKPINEMPKYYKKADAMLVMLSGESDVSGTIPAKVQTYMAAGKPIIGSIGGEAQRVIKKAKCGYCGKPDNAEDFVRNIKKFIANKNKDQLGKNSNEYYLNNFRKEKCIKQIDDNLRCLLH